MGYVYNVYGPDQVQWATNEFNRVAASSPTYTESAATKTAKAQADQSASAYKQTVDQGYSGAYDNAINRLAGDYMNNKFKFSENGSSEFQALGDKYRREGQRQQENTQGSYAANTGGYSNSYAQAAGQRAYGSYMDELQGKLPGIRQTAQNNFNAQQEQTLNQLSVMRNMDETSYQRFRDKVQDNYDFMTYYQNKYNTERGLDMSQFQNELTRWQAQYSAASSNLSNIRQLAESQYEHNTVSADTQASINSSKAQNDAYYSYLNSKLK